MPCSALTKITMVFDRLLCDECGQIWDTELIVENQCASHVKCPTCGTEWWFMVDLEKVDTEKPNE